MNIFQLSFLILLLVGNYSIAQTRTPVQLHGQLRVVSGKIVGRNNKPPQLRGVSLSWSIWAGRKYYNEAVVNWFADDFKLSVLRVSMAIEPEQGYLKDPEGQTALVTKVTDAAIKRGLYVLIDWHDHHAHLHTEQAKDFFRKMAIRYKDKPNVLYEIYNEPERVEWPVVKNYAIAVIKEIRKHDKKNLIIVGSPSWDQDVDVAAKDPIAGFNHIAYSFHFYASDPYHQEGLMKKADAALAAKLPLFITEWGVGEANGNGNFNHSKTEKWLKWMESNQLSWVNWNVTDKKETTALLKPGASVSGRWTTDQLTPAGVYIRDKLRLLNSIF